MASPRTENATYTYRGLLVTREQFHALRQVERSNLTLPKAGVPYLRADKVDGERRAVLAFADGHEVAIRPDGTPA